MTIESRYDRFAVPVRNWDSVESFTRDGGLTAGIDVVGLPGGSVVELLRTRDVERDAPGPLPVFFSGAVANRATTAPPYFSGVGISDALSVPVMAISDPIFSLDSTINLGWYTGAATSGTQESITEILKNLAERCGQLLLIGGSGGGFAALYFAERVGEAAHVLAWNPQTDLLRYNPTAVRAYLAVALAEDTWLDPARYSEEDARTALAAADLDSRIDRVHAAGRVLVLQNSTDWHVAAHTLPLMEQSGIAHADLGLHVSTDGRHGVAFASFGEGHAAPSAEIVVRAIQSLTEGDDPAATYDNLLTSGLLPQEDFDLLPGTPRPLAVGTSSVSPEQEQPPEITQTDFGFLGHDLVLAGVVGDHIFEYIRARNEPYERIFIEALLQLVDPGDLVVDVGANIGNHTIAMATAGGLRVVAFEPNDPVADLLDRNVADNDLADLVDVERMAVGAVLGHARPRKLDWSNIGSTQFEPSATGTRMIRLDDYDFSGPVRLIKVDAEGMDIDVLVGARGLIDRDRPVLTCEVGSPSQLKMLDEFAAEAGYTYLAKYNATPTYVLVPARSEVERVRVDRLHAAQLTQTHLATRDLQWQTNVLRGRTDRLEVTPGDAR